MSYNIFYAIKLNMSPLFSQTHPILQEWVKVYTALCGEGEASLMALGTRRTRDLHKILGVGLPDFAVALQRSGAGEEMMARFEKEVITKPETAEEIASSPVTCNWEEKWTSLLHKARALRQKEKAPFSIWPGIFLSPVRVDG